MFVTVALGIALQLAAFADSVRPEIDALHPAQLVAPQPPLAMAPLEMATLVIGFPDQPRFSNPALILDGVSPHLPPAPDPVEYSDCYYRRLTVHRWASWTMLPIFAAEYVTGSELAKGSGSADWAEGLHPALAGGLTTLFVANSVTGAWNLWDARKDPEGRGRRTTHAVLMLLADAGFVATAALADEGEGGGSGVDAHRAMAISSIAVSTVSWVIMLDIFRPE